MKKQTVAGPGRRRVVCRLPVGSWAPIGGDAQAVIGSNEAVLSTIGGGWPAEA